MRKFRSVLPLALGILVCVCFGPACSNNSISITLSPATTQLVDPGANLSITATVNNDSSNKGVAWSLTGPGTLTSETATSVTYVAPTVTSSNSTATVTATSNANTSVIATLDITINTAILGITPTTLPAATVGTPYNVLISAIGGASGAFAWSITSGALPNGLTMAPSTTSTVTISGTPTAVGTSQFTIQVVDSASDTSSEALGIVVSKPEPLTILTNSLPNGTVNSPYSANLEANGGTLPYKWAIISGSLPVGLSLTSAGLISGTPGASGTSSFTVQVTDSTTPTAQTQTADLSITISPQTSNNAKLNGTYAFQVTGFDPNGLFLAAGSLVADGNGNLTSGVIDTNDPAGAQTNVPIAGTYSIDSNNLGTLCFNPSGNTCARTFALAMSSDGNARIIEFDDTTGSGTRDSGVLLKQDTTAFTTPFSGTNYAFGLLGADSRGGRYGFAGALVATTSNSTLAGILDSDDAGTLGTDVAFTGTFVAPASTSTTGRGTLSLTTSAGTTNYSFYVVSASSLLMIETDPAGNPLVGGQVLQQTGLGSLSLSETVTLQTTATCNSTSAQVEAEALNASSTGNGAGTIDIVAADQNCAGALTQPSSSSNGAYTIDETTGRTTVSLPLSDGTTFQPVLYLVAANQAFLIGADSNTGVPDSGVSFGFLQGQSGNPFSDASLSGTYAGGSLAPVTPLVNNQAGIAVVGSNDVLTLTTDISNTTGLSQNQISQLGYSVASDGRVTLTQGTNTVEILYMISPSQFVGISTDSNPRVDAYQQ